MGEACPKRLGLKFEPPSIVIEWLQRSTGRLFHRRIELVGLCQSSDSAQIAEELRKKNELLLSEEMVPFQQLLSLVDRLLKYHGWTGRSQSARKQADEALPKPRRKRISGLSLVARASKYSKEAEISKAFNDMDAEGRGTLHLLDLRSYLGDYLGFGQAEIYKFWEQYRSGSEPGHGLGLDAFSKGYAMLNPYMLQQRRDEVLTRKPDSLGGQQVNLDGLEDCEVYVCDTTAQVFVDFCKRCLILLAPCESSVFVRDCEDCVIWLATKQTRTNNCKRCTFYLYSATEPIIETSEELSFAPWAAEYPQCSSHFSKFGFHPKRNLWNAVFDFTGKPDTSNWRILPLQEVVHLRVELDEAPEAAREPENPVPEVTYELLSADPLDSGESCGEGIANIPQTRPTPPPAPPAGASGVRRYLARDEKCIRPPGLRSLTRAVC